MIKQKNKYYYALNTELIPYRKQNKWGYCNSSGKIVIEPNYSFVDFFEDGVAIVGRHINKDLFSPETRCGLINEMGIEVLPMLFSEIIRSSFGGIIGKVFKSDPDGEDVYRCFDLKGIEYPILPDLHSIVVRTNPEVFIEYKSVYQFSEQFYLGIKFVNEERRLCELDLLDHKGHKHELDQVGLKVRKEVFLQLGYWTGNRNWTKINNKYGLFDKDGVLVIPFIYKSEPCFIGNLAVVTKGNKYGVIDKHNNIIIDFSFDDLSRFKKERMIWRGKKNGDTSFFILEGNEIIPFENVYPELMPGYCRVESINLEYDENDNVYLADADGKMIVSEIFKEDPVICGEYAIIPTNGKYTIIDKYGNRILQREYDSIDHMGLDFFYYDNYLSDEDAGIINSKEELIYSHQKAFEEFKYLHEEMWRFEYRLKYFSSKLTMLEFSYKVYPTKEEYLVGYITKEGKECWEGELKYESLYTQFNDENYQKELDDYFSEHEDFDNSYYEGPSCPACGGREYMCCNYWIERNS